MGQTDPAEYKNLQLDEYRTPMIVIELTRFAMGRIDCDPASTKEANERVRAEVFYSKKEDGLKQLWKGSVYLNPPYSNTGEWVERFIDDYLQKSICQGIILTNCNTETDWGQMLLRYTNCFVDGRLAFEHPLDENGSKTRGKRGSIISYAGPHRDRFAKIFSILGVVK